MENGSSGEVSVQKYSWEAEKMIQLQLSFTYKRCICSQLLRERTSKILAFCFVLVMVLLT